MTHINISLLSQYNATCIPISIMTSPAPSLTPYTTTATPLSSAGSIARGFVIGRGWGGGRQEAGLVVSFGSLCGSCCRCCVGCFFGLLDCSCVSWFRRPSYPKEYTLDFLLGFDPYWYASMIVKFVNLSGFQFSF